MLASPPRCVRKYAPGLMDGEAGHYFFPKTRQFTPKLTDLKTIHTQTHRFKNTAIHTQTHRFNKNSHPNIQLYNKFTPKHTEFEKERTKKSLLVNCFFEFYTHIFYFYCILPITNMGDITFLVVLGDIKNHHFLNQTFEINRDWFISKMAISKNNGYFQKP